MIRDAVTLARKDLLLEVRRREVVLAMVQYVLSTLVIVHFAIAGAGSSEKAAAGMLWAAILFTAVLSLNRCFTADQEEGALDALQLAPIDRAAIWLGFQIMRHRPFGALGCRRRAVHIRTGRRHRCAVAHFAIENLQRLHRVFHGQQLIDIVVI